MKISLKEAAKRAQKQLNSGLDVTSLTHSQFLDTFSKWCGYRNYHEANKEVSTLKEPLTCTTQFDENFLNQANWKIPVNEPDYFVFSTVVNKLMSKPTRTALAGISGSGKTFLTLNLITEVLAQQAKYGKVVRIIDLGLSYKKYAQVLGAPFFEEVSDQALSAWNDPANALVVIDFEKVFHKLLKEDGNYRAEVISFLSQLRVENAFVVIEEAWSFKHAQDKSGLSLVVSLKNLANRSFSFLSIFQSRDDISKFEQAMEDSEFFHGYLLYSHRSVVDSSVKAINWIYTWKEFNSDFNKEIVCHCELSSKRYFFNKI